MDLSKAALRLYVAMTRYADGKTRVARPGQLRLIADLGWTYSGGKPDRRRLHRVLGELEEADLIRGHGTHALGKGRWVHRYLVAPYPSDADITSASSEAKDAVTTSASLRNTARDDADVLGHTMRTFRRVDADAMSAPSKQFSSNHLSSERSAQDDREEEKREQEPEPLPRDALKDFNHDQRRERFGVGR